MSSLTVPFLDLLDNKQGLALFQSNQLDTRYLQTSNNLSDLDNVGTARTNLGLVAGGAGDIWVEKEGDTMTGDLVMTTDEYISFGGGDNGPRLMSSSIFGASSLALIREGDFSQIEILTPKGLLLTSNAGTDGGGDWLPAILLNAISGDIEFVVNTGGNINLQVGSGKYAILDISNIATTDKTFQFPNASGTLAILETAQLFTATQRFGDADNYFQIDSDGVATLVGTARVKKRLYISADGLKAPGEKPATFVLHGLKGAWQFDDAIEANQETVSGSVKLPDDMDITVAPTFSIGWSANGVSPGNCKWQFEYLYMTENSDTTAAAQETLTIVSTASATSNGLVIAEVSGMDLPGANDKAMFWRITRLSADAQDTIADTVEMHGDFFEYTANKFGAAI